MGWGLLACFDVDLSLLENFLAKFLNQLLDVDSLNVQSLVLVGQSYDCFAFAFFILLDLFGDLTTDHAW